MTYKPEILITGATGFIGKNLMNSLKISGYSDIVGLGSKDFNLLDQNQVKELFKEYSPKIVVHLAAYVGGILANKLYPADFCYKNLMMNTMIIEEAKNSKVEKFISLIGGCSYPSNAPNPIIEESLWDGYPQSESASYSIAKKMMHVQLKSYRMQYGFNGIIFIPGNIYGPYDNYSLNNSHVIPGLIHKYYLASKENKNEVIAWGTGKPIRDFIYVEDVTTCIVENLDKYNDLIPINISSGIPISIKELVDKIAEKTNYKGKIIWDHSKPDGQLEKLFDVKKMKTILKFNPKYSLDDGLNKTIRWFIENYRNGRVRI